MVLYNVTIKIDKTVADEWVQWMKHEHMPELMQTGLFVDSKLFRLLDVEDDDGVTYAAQYFCKNLEDYNSYIDNHAMVMREKGFARFGNKFVAFRTIMESV